MAWRETIGKGDCGDPDLYFYLGERFARRRYIVDVHNYDARRISSFITAGVFAGNKSARAPFYRNRATSQFLYYKEICTRLDIRNFPINR